MYLSEDGGKGATSVTEGQPRGEEDLVEVGVGEEGEARHHGGQLEVKVVTLQANVRHCSGEADARCNVYSHN